jgi:hypothetical protein
MSNSTLSVFTYSFKKNNENFNITFALEIPSTQSIAEHVSILMANHKIPVYLKFNLEEKLNEFFRVQTQEYYDNCVDYCLGSLETSGLCGTNAADVKSQVSAFWYAKLKNTQNPSALATVHGSGDLLDDLEFIRTYHELIHSEYMPLILNKERDFMIETNDLIIQRDKNLDYLDQMQKTKMDDALKMNSTVDNYIPDSYISRLANEHYEHNELEKTKWESRIMGLKDNQRFEFKRWLNELHVNDMFRKCELKSYLEQQQKQNHVRPVDHVESLEESYTIQLGAQLKTTHNLRLIKCDILDYCRNRFNLRYNLIEPHTILNALSLYSNQLCACVLLVDKNLRNFNSIQTKFAKITEESTEFHFKPYEQQLNMIEEYAVQANRTTMTMSTMNGVDESDLCQLNIGDFYITKHSNLSQVSLIFNLVCDEEFFKQKTDLSSRHPLILGLRCILKACCRYDIKTLTLPLLLTHRMGEQMTINWVLKRAELVLKCIKGFMIEFVQWGSLESRTIQFVLPDDLEDETFQSLSTLIKTIFREPRTVNLS